jgi:DNA (cytosine-5)-methyltransferase 1
MKPICFKVRGGGNCSGTKGGRIRLGVKGGGTGPLVYEDKVFTISTSPDQYLFISENHSNEYKYNQPPMSEKQNKIRYLSVCSGMEAASVAWHHMGWKPVGFSEIEPFPSAILKHRFPNVPNYGDLTKHAEWPLSIGDVDLLVGGTPCQSFSIGGKRGGMDDLRGQLALAFAELAGRLRPRWIVWENVSGVLSSGGGLDFAAFQRSLVDLGYCCAWRQLDCNGFGLPQRRKRVFLVGYLGDWRPPAAVLFERGMLQGNPRKVEGQGEEYAGSSDENIGTGCEQAPVAFQPGNLRRQAVANPSYDFFPTVSTDSGDQNAHVAIPPSTVRRLSVVEVERLMGFPDNWSRIPYKGKPEEECSDSPRYHACGNSMAVPVMRWIGERINFIHGKVSS